MVRVRKLVLAIAAASSLSSGMAHALGLGEINLKSSLSQPLDAEIVLSDVRDLAAGEVVSMLASPEEFGKAGVDRQYFLTDLRFTPVIKPNGQSVIRVTSSKPIREPYLNFLVEVAWPSGRALREYTVLLDPPMYSPQAAAAPQLPVAAPAPRPQVSASQAQPSYAPPPARPSAPATARIEGNEYKTDSNDTLWEIAARVRPNSSVSIHQTMLAIQDLNPDAFLAGNINRLKRNQVLRLPDEAQIKSRSQAQAIAQVGEQNSAWREGRAVAAAPAASRQLDATKRASAGDAPAKVETKDSLKLVSADSGKATGGSEKGAADAKALSDKLAVTKESLDSTRRENTELKDRMGDLQSQLDKMEKLVALKDQQLAQLQAKLAEQAKQPVVEPAKPAQPQVAAKPVESKPAAEVKPAAEAKPVVPATQAKPAEQDFNYSESTAKPAVAAKPATEAKPTAAKPAEAVKPQVAKPAVPAKPAAQPAKPKPAPVVAEEPSFIDELMANPLLLGAAGGGALLLLLVGLMVVSRRNAMKEAELQNSLAAPVAEQSLESELDLPESSFEGLEDDTSVQQAAAAEERVTPQTGDPLAEADIYIAYGKFEQAAELLGNAIHQEPQRSDLRLKLMEVLAEMGDREGFVRQENELQDMGGAQAQIDQLKSRFPAMAAVAASAAAVSAVDDLGDFSLDDLTLDDPISEPAKAAPAADLDDAFDLSLEDLESELAGDLPNSSEPSKADDISLDDEFSFDLNDEPAQATAAAEDDLGFDLELSDEPLLSTDAPAPAASVVDELADFDLELADELPAAAADDEFTLSLEEDSAPTLGDELGGFALDAPTLDLPAEPVLEPVAEAAELPMDFDLSLADEPAAAPLAEADDFAAQLEQVSAELDQMAETLSEPEAVAPAMVAEPAPLADALEGEEDFDFLSGTDETATKLDLARAYIDMGDSEGARDILGEVLAEGNDAQKGEARELIAKLV